MTPRRRAPAARSLRRKVALRRPRKTLLVFCEGERSEPEYLAVRKQEPAVRDVASVDIRVEVRRCGSAPLTLVQRAVEARRKAIDEEACRIRRRHDGQRDKGVDAGRYMAHRALAADRAAKLDSRHTANGTRFPENNPSSGMHLLLASVEDPRTAESDR